MNVTNLGSADVDLYLDLDWQGLSIQTTGYAALPYSSLTPITADFELINTPLNQRMASLLLGVGGVATTSNLAIGCSLSQVTKTHTCSSGPQVSSFYIGKLLAGASTFQQYSLRYSLRDQFYTSPLATLSASAQLDRAKLSFRGVDIVPPPPPPPTGVPEPTAWALMIVGFGLAGSAFRRRDRVAAS